MVSLNDVAPIFSFVVSKGFVLNKTNYDSQAFGNFNLLMSGTTFSLRFERDRGQVFVDIGNDMIGWYKLEYVLEFVDRSITQNQLGEPPDITLMANFLQELWDKIANLFNDQKDLSQLQVFNKQKTAELLGKIFGTQRGKA